MNSRSGDRALCGFVGYDLHAVCAEDWVVAADVPIDDAELIGYVQSFSVMTATPS